VDASWEFILDLCLLSAALLLATFLRTRIKWLQTFFVPNNIVAGFLLLAAGSEISGIVPIAGDRFGGYVYHLLALTFIAMALRPAKSGGGRPMVVTGLILTTGYALQAFLGCLICFAAIAWFQPDLFPTFGYFLVLGFGQGPGQAYAMGKSWEPLGFEGAGSLGLTFAAVGYLWACLIGVGLVYWQTRGARRLLAERLPEDERRGVIRDPALQPEAGRQVTTPSAIDSMTFQLALVGLVYLATFALLKGFESLLQSAIALPAAADQAKSTIWGLHFIFATIMAISFRKAILRLGWSHLLDNGSLTRISGAALDFMVVASIAAISIGIFRQYLALILITTTVGGLATVGLALHTMHFFGLDHPIERMAAIFGTLTGTLSTGLTLSRIVDPQFKTPASSDLVFGCGLAFPLSIPVLLSVMGPLMGRTQASPVTYFGAGLAFLGVYTLAVYMILRWSARDMRVAGAPGEEKSIQAIGKSSFEKAL